MTRYLRAFQSRQSLLLWAAWNERLDGRTDATRPGDLDFAAVFGADGHPPIPGLAHAERMTLARWVDLGAPIDLDTPWGFLEDDLRPTLVLRPGLEQLAPSDAISRLEIAAFDVESGVVPASLSVTCDQPVGPAPPGTNLAAGAALDPEGARLVLQLPGAVPVAARATFTVSVRDQAGHETRIVRTYAPPIGLFSDGFESGDTGNWSSATP